MNWIESIKEIQRAQENDRLVIFVGSGVSNNSSIPTWKELIKEIAIKIEYLPFQSFQVMSHSLL